VPNLFLHIFNRLFLRSETSGVYSF
jgi:hypothetical protein